ncbi:MAG: head-tail connector protein [Bilifractor sp.]|nr:head-tail connector protein [Bilifractor sp.]
MQLTLEEAKTYLRIDYADEDELIESEISAAERLVADVLRKDSLDDAGSPLVTAAVLYALAYLNEHREEADHHALILSLRAILFGERSPGF